MRPGIECRLSASNLEWFQPGVVGGTVALHNKGGIVPLEMCNQLFPRLVYSQSGQSFIRCRHLLSLEQMSVSVDVIPPFALPPAFARKEFCLIQEK